MPKNIWPKIGNSKVIEFLKSGLKNNKISQTYVFAGLDDLGKSTVALAFAQNLQGSQEGFNSDLHILQPEEGKKSISIEAVREFIKTLNLSSFLNSYKIGIIKEADCLSMEAKSALLKTLEEPREKVIIILLVSNENSLPATILSRSQVLHFYPVPASIIYDYLIKNHGANRSLAKDLANLSLGRPLTAVKLLENPVFYQTYLEQAKNWLSLINLDLNSRFQVLDKFLSDRSWSAQSFDEAGRIITMAEGLFRDLLLLSLGQRERLQHSALIEDLEQTLNYLNEKNNQNCLPEILRQLKIIAQAREYLEANVNPRLILEQVAANI